MYLFCEDNPCNGTLHAPLDNMINEALLPSILDSIFSPEERLLMSITRIVGLGIPVKDYLYYVESVEITAPLVMITILQGDSLPNENKINQNRCNKS